MPRHGFVVPTLWAFVVIEWGSDQAGLAQSPLWDAYPRLVESSSVSSVLDHHGNVGFNGAQSDPGWGTYGQKVTRVPSRMTGFHGAGLKVISYFETFGQSYCFIGELGPHNGDYRTTLTQHWNWEKYRGGPTAWIGVHSFFDDEAFARPYTRAHPAYGGPAMTYPDGAIAAGYIGDAGDPRNSRIYDAAGSKDILGRLDCEVRCNTTVNAIDPNPVRHGR